MPIVLVPGPIVRAGTEGSGAPTGPAVGRLAATMLQVTVAGMADPQRFRRGKTYLAERSVTRLEIDTGQLQALVVGSRREAYQVIITCRPIERPDDLVGDAPERHHVTALTPQANQLLASCTCPDWEDPCKHAVATLLALANELNNRPDLLVVFRCGSDVNAARAQVGSRSQARHLRLVSDPVPGTRSGVAANPRERIRTRTTPQPDPFELPAWQTFVGAQMPRPTWPALDQPVTIGTGFVGSVSVGEVVRSALRALRNEDDAAQAP